MSQKLIFKMLLSKMIYSDKPLLNSRIAFERQSSFLWVYTYVSYSFDDSSENHLFT